MRRAAWLAVALVAALPALSTGWILTLSTSYLVQFLSGGSWQPLTAITARPVRRTLTAADRGRLVAADLYLRGGPGGTAPGLVLVHGLSPRGKDEPELAAAARLLARMGLAVAVPTVSGLTTLRLRPEDAGAVRGTVRALWAAGHRPVAVLGVSVGAGPALLAAADPDVSGLVSAVLALGGYASSVELLRYTLTGAFALDDLRGDRPVHEEAIRRFARANAELVDAEGGALVDNRDPAALDGLIARLPAPTRNLLDALSPERVLSGLRAPLYLVHGRDDPAVPFTESLRLAQAARAAGRPARLVVVGALGHVDPAERADLTDLVRLGLAMYAFRALAGG